MVHYWGEVDILNRARQILNPYICCEQMRCQRLEATQRLH
jgi:hypothetical protein